MIEATPQNDISTIWGDVWLRTASEWDNYPLHKRLDLTREDHQIYDIAQEIRDEREEFKRVLDSAFDNPVDRFMNNLVIPVTVFAAQQSPYGRAATAVATTARVVAPKLGQIATSLGATAAYQKYSTFLSKKADGDNPKPRAGTTGYKSGKSWDSLTSVDSPAMQQKIGKINKQAFGGGQMRTDGEYVFRFDPAHKTGKIHMEMYRKVKNNHWKPHAEVDPETGVTIRAKDGKIETWG